MRINDVLLASKDDQPGPIVLGLAALVHVALVLIVALIVVVPARRQVFGLTLPLGVCNLDPYYPNLAVLDVDFDGRYLMNGVLVADRAALEPLLAASKGEQGMVMVRVNMLAPYGAVTHALGSARRQGVTHIELMGKDAQHAY